MLLRRTIPSLIVAAVLPISLAACGDASSSSDPRTQIPLVRTGLVMAADQGERTFTGIIAPRVQSDLGFRVPGKVMERLVDTGQTIKRGQPLMRIDPTDLQLATRAYEEAVSAAMARAYQTAEDEVRFRDLVATGAVSASSYDKIKAAAESASAELRAAQARAEVARNENAYTVLLADADGVIVETLAEPGQVVAAGQVVIRLAHAGRREALINLPEALRPAVGSAARAALYGSGLDGMAKLRQLSDAANPQTRTFEARYVLEGRLADAPLGSTVAVQLPSMHASSALQVPLGAIFDSGKGPGVWLITAGDHRVTWRAVKVASLTSETAVLDSGVAAGDRIVVLGAHLLNEGEQVRLADDATKQTISAASISAADGVRP
ncbi:efflux RND transporter periplasmic adaptor subunit [Pseudomethylobacillus aquaticus]|uniref:Efflux RND transporter periplasmic adaptor subunit n=1 Tax=Pseudomethylobacillus aquaticus TaxID=2676064 RepID=A0A3N0V7I1_9PROT|nr:efflux RND transporter periplasmic adaptor subunit [Pseudomethylobacillus aquaticus]ROH88581.1 efflux RND transporter periplasmic adaptor subunit [Pseudomethylobacillus aquaticus]